MTGRDARQLATRALLAIGGEATQSAFHLAVNLALMQVLPARDYGIFALMMVLGGLGLTYVRSLTALPASISISPHAHRRAADAYEVTFGSGVVALALLFALVGGGLLHAWGTNGAAMGGAFVGLWSVRSHLRTVLFARRRQGLVGLGDIAFAASGAGLAALVLLWSGDVLADMFTALAGANALGIAAMLLAGRRRVRLSAGRHVRRRYRGLARQLGWSLVSITTTNIQGQSVALLVAALAGPAAYAPIAAALVLFVPLRIAAAALASLMHPELAGLLARGETRKVWRMTKLWSLAMGTIGLVYGAGVMLLLPLIPSQALQGAPLQVLGLGAWAAFTLTMLYVMPRIVLEIVGAFREIAIVSALGGAIGAAVILVALALAPPAWAMLGGAVSELAILAGSWWLIGRLAAAPRRMPDAMVQAGASPSDEANCRK